MISKIKTILIVSCLALYGITKAQNNNRSEALSIILDKNSISKDANVDFVDRSKNISLPADGFFLYSSLNNHQNFTNGYDSNENYVVTINNPSKQKIRVRTDYIALADKGDVLSFFDGPDTLHPLLSSYSGNLLQNELIVSHSEYITISFKSNSNLVSRGFRLRIDEANLRSYALSVSSACLNITPAADACINSPLICNPNGYCGNTSGQYTADNTNLGSNNNGPFCGSIENNSWLSFIASSTSAQFQFISAACQSSGSGIQAIIFATSNCSNFTQMSNCVNQNFASGAFTITTNSPLTIGTKYYIMVDGFGGNICNYSVTAQSGVSTSPQITANPLQICPGSSTQLGSTISSSSYNWTASTGGMLPNTSSITVSPTVTTTYTLQVGPSVCSTVNGIAVQTVTVTTALPPPNITAPSDVCAGNVANLTSLTNGGTFIWTGPNGFTSSLQNPVIPNFSISNQGTYTLVISYGPGCQTAPAFVTIIFKAGPNLSLSASPSNLFCIGQSITLTASGGSGAFPYTWDWDFIETTGSANVCAAPLVFGFCLFPATVGLPFFAFNAGAVATFTPNQTTQVCVSASANGCTSNICRTLTQVSAVSLSVSSSVTTCPTQPVLLTAAGAATYTWTGVGITSSLNNATVTANPATSTIYTVSGTGCGGAFFTNTVSVIVSTLPPFLGAIVTPTLVCPSQTDVNFSVNNIAGTNYNWTLPLGSIVTSTSSTTNNLVANYGSGIGVFTASVTASNTCGSSTETISINVSQISILATAIPSAFCNPGSSTITVSGANWYDILPVTGLAVSSGTNTSFVATPTISTSYTITGNQGACINSTVVTISVFSVSGLLTVSPSLTTCPTGIVSLTVSGSAGTLTWSPSVSIIGSNNNATAIVNPSATTIYTVTSQGCSAIVTNTVLVTVLNTIPIFAAATPTAICIGGSSTLTASGANSYSLSPSTNLTATNGAVTIASPPVSTSYTVTNLIASCSNIVVLNINVSAIPVYTITSSSSSICIGQSASLTAIANGVTSYSWNTGSSQNPLVVSPSTNTTYTVIGNSSCPARGIIALTVNPTPSILVNSQTICANSSATLIAAGAGSYLWNTGSTNNPLIVSPSTNSTYSVIGTNNFGCSSTQIATVTIKNLIASFIGMPNATETIEKILTLENTSIGASNVAWQTCYGMAGSLQTITLPLLDTGICCVKLYAYDGTCIDSITNCVNVIQKTRLIVPNVFTPNDDGKNDVFTLDAIGIKDISAVIYDRWGIKMFEVNTTGNIKWDGKNKGGSLVTNGTYFYIIKAVGSDSKVYDLKGTISVFD